MKKKSSSRSAGARALIALILLAVAGCLVATGTLLAFVDPEAAAKVSKRTLTFAERVAYQRAIEEVYWRHRIWPKDNPGPKPALDAIVSREQVEKKVENYLRKSQLVAEQRGLPIIGSELQAEMERMASHTRKPEMLRELFAALGNDPFVIAECLARPILAERLSASSAVAAGVPPASNVDNAQYKLPEISALDCAEDTWTPTTWTHFLHCGLDRQ